jgi:DNA-binding response OmpR family regulator
MKGEALKGALLLLVEDHPAVGRALSVAVADFGMVVVGPVGTTREARDLALTHHPQLAVVDIRLNGEVGTELANWLCERGVGVVAASAFANRPSSLSRDAAFLEKPFDGEALIAALVSVHKK